jgi:[ribosomal protein S18]-alanine N-acetyltransferase
MGVSVHTVRPMTTADVAVVADLERSAFSDPWPPAVFFEELALAGRVYVVAETMGRIAGYGGLMLVQGDAHVMTIAVAEAHRRSGEATRVLLALIEAALERGAASITLEVRASNAPAAALYRKFGFVPVGVRTRYYRDEDAVIMWVVDAGGDAYRRLLDAIREDLL